ncbi:MAG: (2Fe-2S)-binding protein [Planctomycetes bacterium]|nr:(2Fe-2S)-binding protein [Planctomycetota bacterium]MCB9886614.1 (2Fe-2S)-binding protein [Planctomycetota bacterium]
MDLVEVRFPLQDKFVLVQPGTTLLAAAELAGVELLTGCRRGQCGTDAIRVVADRADALEAPADGEAGTLSRMGVDGDCRLACSARVRCGRVEVLGDPLI